jgi:hypothetical protein
MTQRESILDSSRKKRSMITHTFVHLQDDTPILAGPGRSSSLSVGVGDPVTLYARIAEIDGEDLFRFATIDDAARALDGETAIHAVVTQERCGELVGRVAAPHVLEQAGVLVRGSLVRFRLEDVAEVAPTFAE